MQVFQNGIELYPAQFKFCLISLEKIKLINSESNIREFHISEVQIIDNDSQTIINRLKKENQKLQNDVKDLLHICKENDISIEDENGNVVVNGGNGSYHNNQSRNYHTEQVVYEDNTSDLICGIALGALLF